MAVSSLLTLIDDIAGILDYVATLTKVATKKTAGVLGDDLALNAQQVSGVNVDRELPVVWAVAKGSLVNKAILVPAALAIGSFAPWAVTPLLMAGGLFLCYEGVEKLVHRKKKPAGGGAPATVQAHPTLDSATVEKTKVRGAIRTDFILSAEIIVITLGTVAGADLATQVTVLVGIALLMTLGVYGLVAGIVKLDDAGLWLSRRPGDGGVTGLLRGLGVAILKVAPYLMKTLSIAGTIAMFLVGGGILVHGNAPLHHAVEAVTAWTAAALGGAGKLATAAAPMLLDGLVGVVAGAAALALVTLGGRFWPLRSAPAAQ